VKEGAERNRVIQRMFKSEIDRPLLSQILDSPVLVEHQRSNMMANMDWNVGLTANYANDKDTGQRLDLSQMVFPKRVRIKLSPFPRNHNFENGSDTILVQGNTEQVLNRIHKKLKYVSEELQEENEEDIWFCSLTKTTEAIYTLKVRYE
jgi:hypothetical protein